MVYSDYYYPTPLWFFPHFPSVQFSKRLNGSQSLVKRDQLGPTALTLIGKLISEAWEDGKTRVLRPLPLETNRISFNCRSALLIESKLHRQLKIKLKQHWSFFFQADENCSFAHELSWKLQRETRRNAVEAMEFSKGRGIWVVAKWLAVSEELIMHFPNVLWWFSSPLSIGRWNFNYPQYPTSQNCETTNISSFFSLVIE